MDDIVITPDGRQVGRLDTVFKANLPITEAQIVQESSTRLSVRFVPAEGFTSADGDALTQRLKDRVGNMDVVLQPVTHIPRSANGKFRSVIRNFTEGV